MEVLTGRSIGPYRIVSLIGRGGMGAVDLARDTRLNRQVALKFVRADRSSPEDDRRLLMEARTASALNHPGICQIFDVGSEGGASWIAMEYVEGRPLVECIPVGGVR